MGQGPLTGVRILEFAGIGPVPHCGMLLSDMGAEILRLDRPEPGFRSDRNPRLDVLSRGRRSVAIDLKSKEGRSVAMRLSERADIVLEGFRPGVMERLGLGPNILLSRNPKLVFARMTGWGQDGPLSARAGHDLNYIALTGALHAMGARDGKPPVPLNLIGDFGGGALYLAFGVVCALLHARQTGQGQVVDAAMVDGTLSLMSMFFGMRAQGLWNDERGTNFLDGAAPFYDTYATADGKYVAIGAVEPEFWAKLLERLGLDDIDPKRQRDRTDWPHARQRLTETFLRHNRDEWCARLEDFDTCFAPVLALDEVSGHRHMAARASIVPAFGVDQPAPAPRLSATPARFSLPPPYPGEHTDSALQDWGLTQNEILRLKASSVIGWRGNPWPIQDVAE